ncbi:hypothetical protein TNCV_850551 [Trichonephila clavipes]|uniref:Uncharacterized protein n=1 Tax=Trichonephila clavipes TaxID=2585209 RepID=A0A8X6V1V2_TRICX|nr:hypothetical protein TNCV_850551 [Trichonephila clavipes]
MTSELVARSLYFHTTLTWGVDPREINVQQSLYDESSVASGLEPTTRLSGLTKSNMGLLQTDLVILNRDQVLRTPELTPFTSLNYHITPKKKFEQPDFSCISFLHGGSSVVPRLELMTSRLQAHDH